MSINYWVQTGVGAVSAELALQIADAIERRFATIKPGERVLYDLSLTAAPKREVIFTPEVNPRPARPVLNEL